VSDQWRAGLAATKLRPPVAPAHLVRRSRLGDVLDAGIDAHARLILVSAPAGSGKSTLLASWLATRAETVAWLQAEASDADPARFWSYLVEAIERARPIAATELHQLISASNGDELVTVSGLVNHLAAIGGPLLVVVDDYHVIENHDIHRGVERLIDLCPPQVTIVLSTRIDPPFRLGRLRVRQQIAEVRGDDLRFDAAEASGLLGSAAKGLDAELLDQLCGRTEGWAAGLVLAGLALERAGDPAAFIASFRGDDQLVVDYLRDEYLSSASDDDRQRLLDTSILDQLSGPLIDAVTQTSDGAIWLRRLAATNQMVIGLDRTGTWYRYHHLFRDLLRLEAQDATQARLPALHSRAAAWFESHDDHARAIDHRLAARDMDAAVQIMRVYGPQLLRRGEIETLRRLLGQFGDVARTSTACSLLFGWCEYIGGRYALAESWLETALAVAPDGLDRTMLTSLSLNISLARGDVGTAVEVARRMIETNQLVSHPSDLATATGGAFAWAGQVADARSALAFAVEKAADERHHPAHLLALVYRTVVEFDAASLGEARAAASVTIETAARFGLGEYYGIAPAYAIRARTEDDPDAARGDASTALRLARRASTDLALAFVLTACGDTLNDLDTGSGGGPLLEARSIIDRCPDPGIAGRYLARVESRHKVAVTAPPVGALVEQMTDREMAVLRHLPTAMSQRDIASELYVSLNTVKTHCRAIYRKLGVGDRKAAVQAARDRQLL
jgi:LuxR family maltose regulon positive regulatory protein